MFFYRFLKEKGNLFKVYQLHQYSKKIKFLGLFDEEYYLERYPDVKNSKINPLDHYLYYGYKEGRNPGCLFDTNFYLKKYPDVKKSGINPLIHYVDRGMKENRVKNRDDDSIKEHIKETNAVLDSANALFNTIFLDYELQSKGVLKDLQDLSKLILLFIKKICEKHDISWWLDGGTLLGAVRHGDFIPWDDDMDIAMMREDYHKFISVLYDELEAHNLSDCIRPVFKKRISGDGKKVTGFIQISIMPKIDGRYKVMGRVDIFPFDFLIDYDDIDSLGVSYNRAYSHLKTYLTNGSDLRSLYMGLDVDDVISRHYSELNLSFDRQKYIIPGVEGGFGYHRNINELIVLDSDRFLPLKEISFSGLSCYSPNDADYYLKSIYGDYMTIPKKIATHKRIDTLRDVENIDELYSYYIKRMEEAIL